MSKNRSPAVDYKLVTFLREKLCFFALIVLLATVPCQADVLTKQYDNQRTGANLSETILTPSIVGPGTFGRLFQFPVDDQVYAGLLYVSGLSVGGAIHNVVYVATVNNSVYAFDADTLGAPLWQVNFNGTGRPTTHSEVGQLCGTYNDFTENIGIVGTPVIDRTANAMYFVTRTVEAGATVQRLHSIDITTGLDRANSPQVIQASVPGTGDGSSTVSFNPQTANQRPALSLSQGVVYVAWASFCDTSPFHGWLMAFDSSSLTMTGVFNTSPNGYGAGIWMGGGGPAFDSFGNLYLATGNGTTDHVTEFSEAVLKFSPGTLALQDYFIPADFATLNADDGDIGSVAPSFMPGTNMLIEGSKQGIVFLLNGLGLGNLGDDTQIPQYFQAVQAARGPTTHHIHTHTVFWNSPQGMNLYVWGENDYVRAFRFNGSTFSPTAFAVGSALPPQGMPGGMITLSANGSTPGTGILWGTTPLVGDANKGTCPGILYAFNAETLQLLWSSSGSADDPTTFAKFNNPIVANGKVYVGSLSNVVSVYGIKYSSTPTATPALKPAPGVYGWSQNVTITDSTQGSTIYYTTDATTPTRASTPYTGPIFVPWGATIRAMAVSSVAPDSAIATGVYSINRPLTAPGFNPAAGSYAVPQPVALVKSDPTCKSTTCTIYYTLDGTTPTISSAKYTVPIQLTTAGTTTVKAIVTAPHYGNSPVASAVYTTH